MSNGVVIRTYGRSSSSDDIVTDRYTTIIQPLQQDHGVMGFMLDNLMHDNEMKICYFSSSIDKLLHAWNTNSNGIRVGTRETCFDLRIVTRISISWMTKTNRRGVTCTRKVRICFGILFVPLFVRKSSF